VLLAVGYGFFGLSTSFWTVAPWVIISSIGYHTWLQTQPALGMSLTTEHRSGSILGRLSAINNAGALVAMLVVLATFHFGWMSYRSTFAVCGVLAAVAAVAIFGFPHLHNGEQEEAAPQRPPMVLRRDYRYYYLLNLFDGARQQIFFSFGLWVLVDHFGLDVPVISAVLLTVAALSMGVGSWIGRLLDRQGERRLLAFINVAYVVALAGYALIDNVAVAICCYIIYQFIFPLSAIGSATYLRKVAPADEVAPSLAMGVTMQHAAAIAVPVAAGFILNYVGYQIPFLIACVFALMTFAITHRLHPDMLRDVNRWVMEICNQEG